ncbi:MAG: hypothetical protein KGL75_07130 [Acidobacteriota bacterium]|nr:hypothetical protein [Acidobacteriota bacterium]
MPNRAMFPARRLPATPVADRNGRSIRKHVPAVVTMAALSLLSAAPALAHHSHAMFDPRKQMTLVGTVKSLEWNNPHCWIQLLVPDPKDPKAAPVEWGIEMGAPLELFRHGWKPTSLKPGDKVTVVINPLRDGCTGGEIVYAIGPDGKPIGRVPPKVQPSAAAGASP